MDNPFEENISVEEKKNAGIPEALVGTLPVPEEIVNAPVYDYDVILDKRKFIEEEFKVRAKTEKEGDEQGQIIPFKLNQVQAKYYDMLLKDRGNSLDGSREIILKARQQGFSTFILALFTVDFITKPHSVSICISHQSDATRRLFKRVHFYIESYCARNNFDIKDYLSVDTKDELENATNGAYFYLGTAGSKVGGRGDTVTNLHFCLSGSQMVIGEDGFVYSITNPPSRIRDGNGSLIDVIDISKRIPEEAMKRIIVAGNSSFPIEATLGHKLLCRKGSLRYGDKDSEAVMKEVKYIEEGDYIGFPLTGAIRIGTSIKYISFNTNQIELDFSFGEFLGWYLAEGNINKGRIDLTINKKEIPYVKEVCGRVLPYLTSISIYNRKDNDSATISLFGTEFSFFIKNLLGEKENKKIPDKFFLYGKKFLIGLIKGFFLGDGTFSEGQTMQSSLASIRPQLIIQLKRLFISLRIGYPQVIRYTQKNTSRNSKEVWKIIVSGKCYSRFMDVIGKKKQDRVDGRKSGYNKFFKEGEKFYWAKVRKVEDMDSPEYVYDIVLAQDPHSFCLVSGVSGNSEAAFYQDTEKITPKEIIEATIQQVPQDHGMIFIESTGGHYGSYYQGEWERAKEKESNFTPRFFSWQELYTPEWIEKKRKDFQSEAEFKTHYPLTEEEAFIYSGDPFFDREVLLKLDRESVLPVFEGRLASDGQFI